MKTTTPLLAVGLMAIVCRVDAATQTYTNKADFIAATSATNCTGPFPQLGVLPGGASASRTVGEVTFTVSPPATTLEFGIIGGDWTPLLAGNEIAMNAPEHLNAQFAHQVYSAGFDFVEPGFSDDALCPFADSTFVVTLKRGGIVVASFTFNAPNDMAAFVGVHSDAPFDRLEIRDEGVTCDDEYFGEFYCGSLPLSIGCPPASIRLSEVEVCWLSQSNSLYRVDYRSDLTTNIWAPLFTNLVGSGESMCVYDKIARGQPQRFYRVVCLPE